MNFLAHLHLAAPNPDAIIGNAIADLIRGPDLTLLPPAVQAGVRTHRKIDAFTDSHPMVNRSIARISGKWGWFSGIIIDIYYDYVLATEWAAYSAEPYRDFAERMYDVLEGAKPHVNAEGRHFLEMFRVTDRLGQYATVAGITDTLARVSWRIAQRIPKRAMPLEEAMPVLTALHVEIRDDFRAFYPELRRYAAGLQGSPQAR